LLRAAEKNVVGSKRNCISLTGIHMKTIAVFLNTAEFIVDIVSFKTVLILSHR
jgi:hypothetical protein